MSRTALVRTAKSIAAATLAVLVMASIGTASAAPSVPSIDQPAGTVLVSAITSPGSTAAATAQSRAIALRAAHIARLARYTTFTLRSTATKDMRGVERSLYRGKYFRPSMERFRECIATRESEGHYDVTSWSGSYRGAYQVSRALARGATWMMLREHKKLMGVSAAKKVLATLRATPMNRWPRYWQDAAFSTVLNWKHTGSGAAHWAGGRWHC
jgi:hypothetical protein